MILIHKETAEIFEVLVCGFQWSDGDSETNSQLKFYNPELLPEQMEYFMLNANNTDKHADQFEILGWL